MSGWYHASVTVHVLAALLWLGGMLFLGAVGAPALRAVEPPALRAQLFHAIGVRFRRVGWACIAVLVATGTANLWFRGWLRADADAPLFDAAFWATGTGHALAAKLAAVSVMLAASAVHDFVLGPRAGALGRAAGGMHATAAAATRRRAALLARINALVGVGLVAAAVRLAR